MRRDRIGMAMNAGKRWAEQQLKKGVDVTPSAIEEAAHERFIHAGSRHIFCCAALETALLRGTVGEDTPEPQSIR